MSSAKQNRSIAKLIIGAMAIDGELTETEHKKVAATLDAIGMGELIADLGACLDSDDGSFDFNMYEECDALLKSLGSNSAAVTPLIYRTVADVVAHDRFVSSREATYLSAMAKRLEIDSSNAKSMFRQVMADRRARLEISGSEIDELIHPHLKDLLSFEGAERLVGKLDEDSLEELMHEAAETLEGAEISGDDVSRALAVLGLEGNALLCDAEEVWHETIKTLDLPKMAKMGETFVSAAISRITRINEAYKTLLQFDKQIKGL